MNHSEEKQEKGAVTCADERLKDKTQWGCGEGWGGEGQRSDCS